MEGYALPIAFKNHPQKAYWNIGYNGKIKGYMPIVLLNDKLMALW
jgi:hypothetical protein